jgi:murein DD-endopeptidase MepM/ murein hydrolase activator NlpD
MMSKKYNPVLANELSEIYAWSIDFFGLQPADSFSVIYDELYVDSVSIGLGRIHAAYFRSSGTDFYAIPFVQDSVESYYDLEGNSLRKAFLKAPLRFSRISSRYSHSRVHPVLKIRRPHHGVDYAAPTGTPVQAIGDGKIIEAKRGYNNGGGNYIKIRHNSIYTTAYLHLSGFAPGIATGTYVRQGDVIGYVGSTGLATGPHLDFRFYKNGSPVDPLKVEAPRLNLFILKICGHLTQLKFRQSNHCTGCKAIP